MTTTYQLNEATGMVEKIISEEKIIPIDVTALTSEKAENLATIERYNILILSLEDRNTVIDADITADAETRAG